MENPNELFENLMIIYNCLKESTVITYQYKEDDIWTRVPIEFATDNLLHTAIAKAKYASQKDKVVMSAYEADFLRSKISYIMKKNPDIDIKYPRDLGSVIDSSIEITSHIADDC